MATGTWFAPATPWKLTRNAAHDAGLAHRHLARELQRTLAAVDVVDVPAVDEAAAQAAKLRAILVAKGWVSFPVDHSAFAFKGENLNIVHYKSGKCVISGKGTEDFVKFTLEPDVTGQAVLGYEAENNPEWFEEHAGLDESGKGDLFGPVVSACVIATGEIGRASCRERVSSPV